MVNLFREDKIVLNYRESVTLGLLRKQSIFMLTVVLLLLPLSGCNNDNGTNTLTGRFLDSAVEGLDYVSGDIAAKTDTNGTFHYREGQLIRFYIGDILIGETMAKAIITPLDFQVDTRDTVPIAPEPPVGMNIARFLQALDNDADLTNGIRIMEVVTQLTIGRTIDFNIFDFDSNANVQMLVAELTSATLAGARELPEKYQAAAHLARTLGEAEGDDTVYIPGLQECQNCFGTDFTTFGEVIVAFNNLVTEDNARAYIAPFELEVLTSCYFDMSGPQFGGYLRVNVPIGEEQQMANVLSESNLVFFVFQEGVNFIGDC